MTASDGQPEGGPRPIVVTGGAGFVGASVVRALLGRGDRVRVIDSGVAAGFDALSGLDVELVRADVRDAGLPVDGARAIVHLAAQTSVPGSIVEPMDDFTTNVVGTLSLLEAARLSGVERFVFASSLAAVGRAPLPVRETSPVTPIAPYGAAKAAAEAYLSAYAASYGMVTVAIRLSNVYGPYSLHKPSVAHGFIRGLIAGRSIAINGDGRQTRDFVHVQDAAAAILAALDAPAAAVRSRVIPVGAGVETSIVDLAHVLFTVAGRQVPIEHRPARAGDVPRSGLDVSTAAELLGYRPRVALTDGLRSTYDWFVAALR